MSQYRSYLENLSSRMHGLDINASQFSMKITFGTPAGVAAPAFNEPSAERGNRRSPDDAAHVVTPSVSRVERSFADVRTPVSEPAIFENASVSTTSKQSADLPRKRSRTVSSFVAGDARQSPPASMAEERDLPPSICDESRMTTADALIMTE